MKLDMLWLKVLFIPKINYLRCILVRKRYRMVEFIPQIVYPVESCNINWKQIFLFRCPPTWYLFNIPHNKSQQWNLNNIQLHNLISTNIFCKITSILFLLLQKCTGCADAYKCNCTGIKGQQGYPGIPGMPGQVGDYGGIGPDGPVGPKGEKGEAGEFGPIGEKGYRVSYSNFKIF